METTPGARATRPWHLATAADTAGLLATGPHGLTQAEAHARLEEHGPNFVETIPPPSVLTVLVRQFRSPVIYILAIAAAITLLLGDLAGAAVIGFVLALNTIIGFTQERRAEASVRALMELVSPQARIIRGGREWEVDSREIVPGDLVLLESGVRVPADLHLESAEALEIDESLLTGESFAAEKSTAPLDDPSIPLGDRHNMAYAGSIVTTGRGRGYAVATGMATELGRIAQGMRGQQLPETPLQQRMSQFARIIGAAVAAASAAVFVLGVSLGKPVSDMFHAAVGVAIAAVPEGLPVAFTVTLALGVRRMARRSAIIRNLPAVETLGSTTVICSDKTGTLTENRMTVRDIWAGGHVYRLDGPAIAPAPGGEAGILLIGEDQPLYLTLLAGVLTNEAEIYRHGDTFESHGDPTEAALLMAAAQLGVEPDDARRAYHAEEELRFESERQYSASARRREGKRFVFVKGAPERVLSMCDTMLCPGGTKELDRAEVHAAADAMAAGGLRLLGLAYAEAAPGTELTHLQGLVFLGLHGLLDPPRAGVRDAIAGCAEAGIRVVMITGDHAVTANAIAHELGIGADNPSEGPGVLTGAEIEEMSDRELTAHAAEVRVYARAAPVHKLRIVRALRRQGHVVAVTGDGVNDAPALRAADIGIAMGRGGTDVAREASDMVLADDNFVSIHAAVEEGRVTFDNVRKVTFFLVSTGVAAIVAIFVAVALDWPLPMVAVQLIWLNFVTNGLQDLALAFEPGEKGLLLRPPRPRSEGVLSPLLWERTVITGIVMAVGTLALFRWELDNNGSLEQAQTVALTTMVLFQNFHVGNARSERLSAFAKSPLSNPFLFVSAVGALAIHIAAIYLPPTQALLHLEPIPFAAWVRIVPVALTVIAVVELHKRLRKAPAPAPLA